MPETLFVPFKADAFPNFEVLIYFGNLIFVVPCIMLNSEIIPTRCNNCVYSSHIVKNKLYMFQVTIPPIIRSTMLYMAFQVGRYTYVVILSIFW